LPALRRATPALLGYVAVRALGLAVLAVWTAARGKSAYTLLTARWDALWYTRVAELGYGYEVRLPNGPLRMVGDHVVNLHLHADIDVPLAVSIIAEE